MYQTHACAHNHIHFLTNTHTGKYIYTDSYIATGTQTNN